MLIQTYSDLLQHGMAMACHCPRCERWADVDLERLVATGRGEQSYIGRKAKCAKCGERGSIQIQTKCVMIGTG